MATTKVIFRASSHNSCEGALFHRIIHNRKMRQIHTGKRVFKDEWNETACEIIFSTDKTREEYLSSVQSKLDSDQIRIRRIIAVLDKSTKGYTVDDVVELFQKPETVVGIISFARRHIAELKHIGRIRRAEHYTTALNRFVRFNGDEEVAFEDFNSRLMQKYECHLKNQGLCPNSISYYMRTLRAIYNQAVEQDFTRQNNPFKYVYTGIAKTVKRAVSLAIVKALRALDLNENTMSRLARDLFMFSFYTRGMAIIDVAFLRKENLKNGVLIYRRQKTGKQLTIKWEPQMQKIVSQYANKESDFLFPLIDSRKPNYRRQFLNSYTRINRCLKKFGQQLGLPEPLTFHRSRHTWASIARANNVPLSVICEGMGHDSEKTTRIYLASLDTSIVDNANSKILNLLDK